MIMYKYNLKSDIRYGDKKLKIENGSKEYFLLSERESIKGRNFNEDPNEVKKLSASQEHLHFLKKIKENELSCFEAFDLSLDREKCLFKPILELPNEIFKLSHLKRLHLDGNKIQSLPDILGQNLINLEILTASNNRLTKLPDTLSDMKKLASIHLSNNRLMEFPLVLCQIESLVFLDISSNQIEALPDQIGNLQNLQSLLMNHNKIQMLPDSIGYLVNLKTLWFGYNHIAKLPNEIVNLKKLEWNFQKYDSSLSTIFSNNPINDPPIEILEQGFNAIVNYFLKSNKILENL
jgi:Leucine-rich repeat (LRR) protein